MKCRQCHADLPPRPPGAPGRTRTFCSDRCRNAWHYANKVQPQRWRHRRFLQARDE